MVEVLPGRFSAARAEREAKDWTVNAIGRGIVAENATLHRIGWQCSQGVSYTKALNGV
jgi:hypothetical protein